MATRWHTTALRLLLLVTLALAGGTSAARGAQSEQGGYAPSFEITGAVRQPCSYELADLQRLPAIDVIHSCINENTHALQSHAYRGVLLWTLLVEAQPALPGDALGGYLAVSASDGFEVVLALAEIDPAYDRREVIVAYERDGTLLDETLGMAMLVVPDDRTCGRDVFWLTRLDLRHLASR